jgi:hypothetical protein
VLVGSAADSTEVAVTFPESVVSLAGRRVVLEAPIIRTLSLEVVVYPTLSGLEVWSLVIVDWYVENSDGSVGAGSTISVRLEASCAWIVGTNNRTAGSSDMHQHEAGKGVGIRMFSGIAQPVSPLKPEIKMAVCSIP